jgi:hypothetical protein
VTGAPTIVAVAHVVRTAGRPDLTISMPAPARHNDVVRAIHFAGLSEALWEANAPGNQGFLTSDGRWVSRREAMEIALASGQPFRPREPHHAPLTHELFSEDLW